MKFTTASVLIVAVLGGDASAFSAAPAAPASSTALRAATATDTYTFAKSEEIFAEAKNVSVRPAHARFGPRRLRQSLEHS